jgi:hypothetical protein
MTLFRCVAIALPQILILLFVAGSHDLLVGWNQTGDAMTTILALFLLSPSATLALLITEVVRCYKACREKRGRNFLFTGLAVVLFAESLAINYYLLTQVRM